METMMTEQRPFSFGRILDNGFALAFTGMNAGVAAGTGLPLLQVAAAAAIPGAFEGVRRTFRAMSGAAQKPLSPLMRGYVVASTTLIAPVVNGPSLLQSGLTMAVAGVAAAGLGYAVNQITRPQVAMNPTGKADPSRSDEPVIDLSAEPEAGPREPARRFTVRKDMEVAKKVVEVPQTAAVDAAPRHPQPDEAIIPVVDESDLRL